MSIPHVTADQIADPKLRALVETVQQGRQPDGPAPPPAADPMQPGAAPVEARSGDPPAVAPLRNAFPLHQGLPEQPPQSTGGLEELFTAADLLTTRPRTQKFQMPGTGKWLWVHPVSGAQVAWLRSRARKEVAEQPSLSELEAHEEFLTRARVYQVICACHASAEGNSPVFTVKHAETLRRNPGWYEAVQQICIISDVLGAGVSEAAQLKEDVAAFFGQTASFLQTWCSQLNEGSLEASRQALAAFAFSVSRWSTPESWETADLRRLILPRPTPTPSEGPEAD